ncbi:MAG: type II toxin-antitoxin system VapC family toxin [Candidatus Bathycorpusculaceae bacterium]
MTPLDKKATKVILDSNALFAPLQFRIDIFEELQIILNRKFEPILPLSVKRELEKLANEGSPKMRKNASFALELAKKCNLVDINDESVTSPDEAIIKAAKKWKCPVFTNDKLLRKRLRDINVPVIYVRQKAHLEIDGRI